MNYAIIVAGGTGSRMGTATPKQFLLLDGLPIVMHAIQAFHSSQSSPEIIVVLPPAMLPEWDQLCTKHRFLVPHSVVGGGVSRFDSVKSGLAAIKSRCLDLSCSIVAVHDGARPLITPAFIDKTYEQASISGSAALAIPSVNSVRLKSLSGLKNNAYRRENVYLMQTPQTFNGLILATAYEQGNAEQSTDDACVVEKKGYPITLVDGDTRNIKITFPEDLHLAEILLSARR
ncbi:2-C-methyl-D-erythritol 4-phosphate cytidylyltransferase [Parapedobacter deserti]|uniref:2-C-methyl-D-erythritol 4-phosphate cytidylyltransferase n=1 Tax=Parapedobacter deserti TaxID=1912957 RepID=A0ABV7JDP2_9SPHI